MDFPQIFMDFPGFPWIIFSIFPIDMISHGHLPGRMFSSRTTTVPVNDMFELGGGTAASTSIRTAGLGLSMSK